MTPNEIVGGENKFIDAGGINTHYYEGGEGQPVILVHGGGAGADAWGNWRLSLATYAPRFRVFAVDVVGFGYSDKPDPSGYEYSQTNRINHLISFIEALDVGPVHLVGNSMGGATTIGIAVERPDLVNRVVLMGSAGIKAPLPDEVMTIMNYDFTTDGMRKIVKGLTNPAFEASDELVNYRHALSIQDDTRAAYSATMGWIKQNGLHYEDDYIRRVSQPTLVVNGKVDLVTPIANSYRLLELIDNSWGFIIPHCGHWAMMEHPKEFTAATMNFLKS